MQTLPPLPYAGPRSEAVALLVTLQPVREANGQRRDHAVFVRHPEKMEEEQGNYE